MVAASSMVAESRKLLGFTARWSSMPRRISVNMSIESVAAGESVPRPKRRCARRNSPMGDRPMPSCALQRGQPATATSYSFSFLMSSSSMCVQWIASTLSDSNAPQLSA